jgi:hypothetical protein
MEKQACPICGLSHFARTIAECPSVETTADYTNSQGSWTLIQFRSSTGLPARSVKRVTGYREMSRIA